MYPACEILEYASIRFTLCCTTALILPIKSVRIAITSNAGTQKSCKGVKQYKNIRRKAAKPAVFTTVLINVVINTGAPSYTSGVQKWKGATPTLKAKPTKSNKTPP